jgi:hypothetical protein
MIANTDLVGRIVENLGATGLVVWVMWKFGMAALRMIEKWAGPFLSAQQAQATAMGSQATAMSSLAQAVQEGQGEQREVLLAVRTMGSKLDDVRGWVREIDEHIRGGKEATRQ